MRVVLIVHVLIVNRFGQKCLLNALNVNVNVLHSIPYHTMCSDYVMGHYWGEGREKF